MFKFISIVFALALPLMTGCTGGDKDTATTDSATVAE